MPRKVQLLLVEDNQDHIFLIKKGLSRITSVELEVNVATNGEEAINYLKQLGPFKNQKRPDMIIMDLKMPKKNGFDVLEEIKGDQNLKSIPILVLTSSQRSVDIVKAHDLGADSYIVKPMSIDSLTKKIEQISNYWLKASGLSPGENVIGSVRRKICV